MIFTDNSMQFKCYYSLYVLIAKKYSKNGIFEKIQWWIIIKVHICYDSYLRLT